MKVPKDFPALVQVDVPGLEDLFVKSEFKPIVKLRHPEQLCGPIVNCCRKRPQNLEPNAYEASY